VIFPTGQATLIGNKGLSKVLDDDFTPETLERGQLERLGEVLKGLTGKSWLLLKLLPQATTRSSQSLLRISFLLAAASPGIKQLLADMRLQDLIRDIDQDLNLEHIKSCKYLTSSFASHLLYM